MIGFTTSRILPILNAFNDNRISFEIYLVCSIRHKTFDKLLTKKETLILDSLVCP
jgi:hypothetical protein